MSEIGPLYLSWCMKFEMKHGFLKRCAHIVCNFKNIAKSLAFSHQFYSAYVSITSLRGNASAAQPGAGNLRPIGSIPHLADLSLPQSLKDSPTVFAADKLNFRGISYHIGDFMATSIDADSGDPSFIQITAIINCNGEWNFVGRKCETIDFLSHFHCYYVKLLKEYDIFAVGSIGFYHPLDCYIIDRMRLIRLRCFLLCWINWLL